MILFPIVARELRVAARRRRVYRLRVAAGCLTLALGAYFLLLGDSLTLSAGTAGRTLFLVVSGLLFAGALAAAHQTYDCISEEKREGTIGFLLLTDLHGHDIALGKLCAAALPSFYAMMATFPLLAAAALMGGVTGAEIWRTSLALLNLFFFAQSAAILASSLARDRTHAAQVAAGILAFFLVGLAAVAGMTRSRLWWATAFNPAYAFALATGMGGVRGGPGSFGLSLLTVHLTAWVFLAGASFALPRLWHERPADAKPFEAARRKAGAMEANPFGWLARRGVASARAVWVGFGASIALGMCFLLVARSAKTGYVLAAWWLPHAVLKLWMAVAAARAMEEHRRNGSLELLLGSTPLKAGDILSGQWRALWRVFRGPAVTLTASDVLCSIFANTSAVRDCLLSAAVQLPLDLVALGWLAMWFARSQSKPRRAAGVAYILVCLAPSVLLGVPMGAGLLRGSGLGAAAFQWALLAVCVDVVLFFVSRDKLSLYLRAMGEGTMPEALKLRLFVEPTLAPAL